MIINHRISKEFLRLLPSISHSIGDKLIIPTLSHALPSLSTPLSYPVRHQSNNKKNKVNNKDKGIPRSRQDTTPSTTTNNKPNTSTKSPSSASSSSTNTASSSSSSTRAGGGVEGEVIMYIKELSKILPGGRILFKDVSLAFQKGAKIGVLGLNGAGKSSLLKILANVDTEFDGELWKADNIHIGYLAQEPILDETKNVHENIMDGLQSITNLLTKYENISLQMGTEEGMQNMDKLLEEQALIQTEIEQVDGWNLSHIVTIAKEALRVPPDDADVKLLSGGERRRVALCRLLLERPQVLLLDEPTNHLDATSVAWLERYLRDYKGTVLAITHDRYFLDNVAGWILEIDRGKAYPYAGNYSVWLTKKAARLDMEKKADKRRAKMMEDELEWIRSGAKARQSKSKARMNRFSEMMDTLEEEKNKEKFLSGAIVIPPGPRLGEQVIKLENISKSMEEITETIDEHGKVHKHHHQRLLFADVNFAITKGAIVGVIGANGAGKTTLLRIITGELSPDTGKVTRGSTVVSSLVSQNRAELKGDIRVLEAVCGEADTISYGTYEMPARQYLAAFNLVGESQTKLVRSLSGGERNRVHLAKALARKANVLLLDEPTNDLDVDTLRSLEEALIDFDGVAILVSHDRYFLDRVATHMVIFHGDQRVEWFEGSYADYEHYAATHAAKEFAAGRKMYVLPGTGGNNHQHSQEDNRKIASNLKM